jgi:hypothetical protein
MKYRYIGNGAYLQGLPIEDVDDARLSKEQKNLLEMAVAMKIFEPIPGEKETVKNDEPNEPQK